VAKNSVGTLSGQIRIKAIKIKVMEKRTANISIPQYVAAHTLRQLEENRITCQYYGVDQFGRILMQVTYNPDQNNILKSITTEMEKDDQAINLLFDLCGLALANEIVKARTNLFLSKIPTRNGTKQK